MRQGTKRVTVDELKPQQRRLYDALPEDMKADFLGMLPPVANSSAMRARKLKAIRQRQKLLDDVISDLQKARDALDDTAKAIDSGNPTLVDLRHTLKPPSLKGAVLRFVRDNGRKRDK